MDSKELENIIPIPSNIEKKMIGRTSPSASEPIGLRGTIPNKRSPILWEDCTALYGSTPVMSMPAPGENNVPSIKPIVIAKRVVNRYKAMVLMPMDPWIHWH